MLALDLRYSKTLFYSDPCELEINGTWDKMNTVRIYLCNNI